MSISLNSAGSMVINSSGTGANGCAMTISAPTSLAAARAVAIPDPGAACNLAFGVVPTVTVITTAAITQAQSGSQIFFTKPAGYTITMPAPLAGLNYTFVQSGAGAAFTVVIDCGVGLLFGGWINTVGGAITGATTAGTGARNFNFLTNASVKGDQVRLVSDGTQWYATGIVGAAAAVSMT
jgi:hypothetical protein